MKVSDFAGYRTAAAKLNELQQQLGQAEKEAASLEACDNKSVPAADRDARAVLSGLELPSATEDGPSARAWRKVHALRRAIELQRVELTSERSKASEKICVDARPRYEAILRKQAAAVEKLVDAHKAEREFREQLMADDVVFSTEITPAGFYGLLDVPGDAARWFAEVKSYGYKL